MLLAVLAVTAFQATAFAADVRLAWDPSPDSTVTGYKLYRGTASRVYSMSGSLGNVTTYTVSGLSDGTYYFAVTAYNSAGAESGYSNEVQAIISSGDTQPPVISGISAGGITSSAATIAWTTSEAADSQVEYGLSASYGSQTPLNTTLVTARAVPLNGLAASTTYHYRVKSRDAAGNLAVSGDYFFTTAAPPDTTPPVISAVQSSSVTSSGAMITWTTNEASDTQVEYGTTTSYGSSTTLGTALVTSHSRGITGLTAGTTYHFRAKSKDAAGNLATSGDYNFTTTAAPDTTPPVISAVQSSSVTSSGATITWTTNEAADTQVEYGTTTSYGKSTTLNTALATSHSQALSGLTGSTTYHYRVKSKDAAANLSTSGDYTFTTTAAPDTTAPVISAVQSSSISSADATITWTTDEAADTQVEYGTTTSYGSSTTLSAALVTSHSQALTGLAASTTYHYRVKSKDAAGNTANSDDYTFTTAGSGADITTGLVAAYSFEEGSGTTTADASGSGNTATINGASWTTRGRFGAALSFDGRKSYLAAGVTGLPDIGTAKTVAFWIYLSGKATLPQSVVSLANQGGDLGVRQGFRDSRVGVLKSSASWLVAANPPSGKGWHHLAYSFDGSQNSLYLDGVLVSTSTISPDVSPVATFEMGRWITKSEYLKGMLDEVRMYNRALNVEEINMAMNTAISAPAPVTAVALTSTVSDNRRKGFEVTPDPDTPGETEPGSQPASQPESRPVVDVRMSQPVYDTGETVAASACWISNPSLQDQAVEFKAWVAVPGLSPIPVENEELKGTMTLPAGLDKDYGSLPLFEVTDDLPLGISHLNARIVDPVTGDLLAQDINAFRLGARSRVSGRNTPGEPSVWQDPPSWVDGNFTWSMDENLQLSGQYTIANNSAGPVKVEVKVWLEAPDQSPVPVFSLGQDGSLSLAEGATMTVDPLASSRAAENLPAGTWRLVARVLDWVTGQVLSQTESDFGSN